MWRLTFATVALLTAVLTVAAQDELAQLSVKEGQKHFAEKKYKQALDSFNFAIKRESGYALAHVWRAATLGKLSAGKTLEDYSETIVAYKRAMNVGNDQVKSLCYLRIGEILELFVPEWEALEAYTLALKLNSDADFKKEILKAVKRIGSR